MKRVEWSVVRLYTHGGKLSWQEWEDARDEREATRRARELNGPSKDSPMKDSEFRVMKTTHLIFAPGTSS